MVQKLEQIFVKPSPGCTVRDEHTLIPLAQEGELKPRSTYWVRRILHKDVILCEQGKVSKVEEIKTSDKKAEKGKDKK